MKTRNKIRSHFIKCYFATQPIYLLIFVVYNNYIIIISLTSPYGLLLCLGLPCSSHLKCLAFTNNRSMRDSCKVKNSVTNCMTHLKPLQFGSKTSLRPETFCEGLKHWFLHTMLETAFQYIMCKAKNSHQWL